MITVRVIKTPGFSKQVTLPDDSTIADAIMQAGLSLGENEVCNLNGVASNQGATLQDEDRIVIATGAKGNK